MSKPFNPAYIRGATNEQLKTSLVYKMYLKTEDEIEGVRTTEWVEPILLQVVETKEEKDEKYNITIQ